MVKILGIDPALNKIGWGIINIAPDKTLSFLACDIIKLNIKLDLNDKLKIISDQINDIITQYDPDEVAMEETFVNKNPLTSLKLGHARGVLIINCLNHNKEVYNYGANQIKKAVCGVGKAEKQQVALMVKILLPKAQFQYDDESDALAAAICHAHNKF